MITLNSVSSLPCGETSSRPAYGLNPIAISQPKIGPRQVISPLVLRPLTDCVAGFQKFVRAFYTVRTRLLANIVHLSLFDVSETVYIAVPNDFLSRLLSYAPDLKALDLSPGFLISHAHIAGVTSFHRGLKTLSLAGCQAFSTTTLPQFLSYFPNLSRLDLSATSGVTPTLFNNLPPLPLSSIRLRHQPYKINDLTIKSLAQLLESNLSDLDLSFAGRSISNPSIDAIEEYCQARPPTYSSETKAVDIGPGPRRLGIAYTNISVSSISRLLTSDMVHLVALDIAGLPHVAYSGVEFWESLRRGGSFSTLEKLRIDFSLFTSNASFNISPLPLSLTEFTLHSVPTVESSPPRVTRVLTMLLKDLIPTNPFIAGLRVLNLEMASRENEQELGMYALDESSTDEIDVVEAIKRWKRTQTKVWMGNVRVIRDITGDRGYAQEFQSGVGDILGRWISTDAM